MADHDREGLNQKLVVFAQLFFEARWVLIHREVNVWRHLLSADGDCRDVLEL